MTAQRILLVSPGFHGYWAAISRALESRGHEVVVHCYDQPGSFVERLGNKILHDMPERLRPQRAEDHLTRRTIAVLQEVRPSVVVVVKGDQLGADWWQTLDEERIPRVTWLYDELRRMRYTPEQVQSIGPIASYSSQDTKELARLGVNVRHLPLAFDNTLPVTRMAEEHVSFIGARYGSRERLLRRLAASGVPVRAYGRSWSRHPYDVLRTRQFSNPGIPAGRDLARNRAYGVMKASPATLNIHGDQDGFTMRTFEAPGVGALQILDRRDVDAFYEIGSEVLVFDSDDELVELCQRAMRDPKWSEGIRSGGRRRTQAEHTFAHRIAGLEDLWG